MNRCRCSCLTTKFAAPWNCYLSTFFLLCLALISQNNPSISHTKSIRNVSEETRGFFADGGDKAKAKVVDGTIFHGVSWFERRRTQKPMQAPTYLTLDTKSRSFSVDGNNACSLHHESLWFCQFVEEQMNYLNAEIIKTLKSVSYNIKEAIPSLSRSQASYLDILVGQTKTSLLEKAGSDLHKRAWIVSTEAKKQTSMNSFKSKHEKEFVENGE